MKTHKLIIIIMTCGMLVLLTIAVAAMFFDWSFGTVFAMIQSQFNFLPISVIAASCSLFYNLIFRLRASRWPVLSVFMMSAALWTRMGFSGTAATYAGNDLDHKVATARRLFLGDEIEQDRDEAYRLYRLAAERGHPEAKNGLGAFYALGGAVERDNQKAVEWFRRAAEQGSGKGQLNLADSFDVMNQDQLRNLRAKDYGRWCGSCEMKTINICGRH